MIIRTRRRTNFTVLPNETLQNINITWEARGMLAYLVSLPEGWEVRVTELANRSPAGHEKNRRILRELEAFGFVRRSQVRRSDGTFGEWIFDVFDSPPPDAGNPYPVGPHPDKPDTARQQQERTHLKKKPFKKKPVARGDGKPDARASRARLSFENEFGFCWSPSHARLLDENRACTIFRHEKITDEATARRIVAEWAASMARHPDGDPAATLVWACRAQLTHTAQGDECLPAWA